MSTTNEKKAEILARARARKAQIAEEEPTESARRRRDQVRRVKAQLRAFILDHGISIKDAGRAMGYESVFRLPRHLGPGKPDIEDLLAMMEYFEDFDPTTILRDVVLGVDEHPDEAVARREEKIKPDGERVAAPEKKKEEAAEPEQTEEAPEAEQEEEPPFEEVVIVPDDTPAPQEEEDPSLDTDEGLKAWANRFGFNPGA